MKWIIKKLLTVDVTCSDQNGYKSSPDLASVAELCSGLKSTASAHKNGAVNQTAWYLDTLKSGF